jgi:hypothetical protein
MGLQSQFFGGDSALEACLIYDHSHVIQGAAGDHVSKIQTALSALDNLKIDSGELSAKRYGPSTAAAVLTFKKKRNIINRSYQTQADDIVGKMTIAVLDKEMLAREGETPDLDETKYVVCRFPESVKKDIEPAHLSLNFGISAGAPTVTQPAVPAKTAVDLVKQDLPEAATWVNFAIASIYTVMGGIYQKNWSPVGKALLEATDIHFHVNQKKTSDQQYRFLMQILTNYRNMLKIFADPDTYFANFTEKKFTGWAHAVLGGFHTTPNAQIIFFRQWYLNVTGPMCRTAMVIHECAHAVAHAVHFADDWPWPTGRRDAPFSKGVLHQRDYQHLLPDEAAKNATSYPSFAAHVRTGFDIRPGAHDLSK